MSCSLPDKNEQFFSNLDKSKLVSLSNNIIFAQKMRMAKIIKYFLIEEYYYRS